MPLTFRHLVASVATAMLGVLIMSGGGVPHQTREHSRVGTSAAKSGSTQFFATHQARVLDTDLAHVLISTPPEPLADLPAPPVSSRYNGVNDSYREATVTAVDGRAPPMRSPSGAAATR